MRRAAAAALAAALACPTAAAVAQEPPPETRPVRVQVTRLPAVLRPGEPLVVRGSVVNTGPESLRDLQVRVHVGGRVETRSELARLATDPPGFGGSGTLVELDGDDDLGPNASRELAVDLDAEAVERRFGSRPGVHPLRIEVRGRRTAGGARRTLGVVDTFLQWWPENRGRPSRLAWVWPLVETSRRDAEGVHPDDTLAQSVAPGGRLDELLAVAAGVRTPVTWAVDPALLDAVRELADGYRVRSPEGEVVDGQGGRAAATWFAALGDAVADRSDEVLALPYGDPDVVALVHQGDTGVVGAAFRRTGEALAAADVSADTTLAWPPAGLVDTDALEVYAANGARTLVVADAMLPVDDPPNYTPTATATLGATAGAPTGVVVDPELERILAEGPREQGVRVAVQRFLAETALIALERPNLSRDMVVTPPRRWAPLRAYARELLELTGSVPWLTPVGLRDVAAKPPDDDVTRHLSYPTDPGELDRAYLDQVRAVRDKLALYAAILPRETEDRLPQVLADQLLRAVSVRWRDDRRGGLALVGDAGARLDTQFAKVRVSTGGLVTMTSDTGRIPLTVINELDEAVRVRIHIDTRRRLVLESDAPLEQTIPPGRTQLTIDGRAVQAGEFTITVKLLTPDNKELPGTAVLRVRSTAYGRVALVVTVGAFGVLLVATVARLVRRRRRTAAAAA